MADSTKIFTPKDILSVANNSVRSEEPLQRKVEIPLMADLTDEAPAASPEVMQPSNRLPTPEEERDNYLKGLKAASIAREDAIFIMDKVVTSGVYTERHKICNRISVVLGTRTYRDLQRAAQLIDNADVNLPMHVNDLIARYNLAASLREYSSKVFTFPEEPQPASDEFHKRLEFLYGLPEIVVNQLIRLLHEFDFKVSVVFAKGAPEDF